MLKTMPVYPASCEAVRDGAVIYIPVDECVSLMQKHPELKQCFQEDFVSNAEFFKNKTTLLMLHTTEERVIFFLEALGAADREVYLNIPKNQVARDVQARAKGTPRRTNKSPVIVSVSRAEDCNWAERRSASSIR